MLRELLSIFRSDQPLSTMGKQFSTMLNLTYDMTLTAGDMFFTGEAGPEVRTRVYEADVQVNMMERTIRKEVIAHLSVRGNTASLPYCLLLMSLVKDVERIGDYAKNLSEARDYHPSSLPDDQIVQEMREIRREIEFQFSEIGAVFASSDHERAVEFIREGRDVTRRCDAVVGRVARSAYDASTATCVVMGARFYKRIAAHVLNVLSSVVMPLHKLDYYDEKRLAEALPEE